MNLIKRITGSSNDLKFKIDLSNYGKTAADVSEIYFSVKEKKEDPDNQSKIFKKYSNSEIFFSGTTVLSVNVLWPGTEYTTVNTGEIYLAGLFIKWTGEAMADENVVGGGVFKLQIIEDYLHEN